MLGEKEYGSICLILKTNMMEWLLHMAIQEAYSLISNIIYQNTIITFSELIFHSFPITGSLLVQK